MNEPSTDDLIAVIGLAARVPGARTADEFWDQMVAGREAVVFLDDDQLLAAGVNPARLTQDNYVRAVAEVPDLDMFDAGMFRFTPREALHTDPQIRLFLEVCHTAIENAGYDPFRIPGSTGVFGSMGGNRYSQIYLSPGDHSLSSGRIATSVLNMPDYLATQVSYKFGFRGPSMTVYSACSSSLVTIHLAAQALRVGECDTAIAGGSDIVYPVRQGYPWDDGSPVSPDGHCRPFDATARGTIFSSGAGAVLLKRLDDALAAGDEIRAVIRGSAVNNDGSTKVGFTAPGVIGQADVIREAMLMAGRTPADISYVEAHGTGTPLGDPVEVAALTRAYESLLAGPPPARRIPVSSVKGNIGHLGHAAGIASFIKVVLSLVHEARPGTANFRTANPALDLGATPFEISATPSAWPRVDGAPRTAGVSALGFGGTNCHIVLEEAPPNGTTASDAGPQTLVWSARDAAAADEYADRLVLHLQGPGGSRFADLVATLQDGRTPHRYRRAVVATDAQEAIGAIGDDRKVWAGGHKKPPMVVFAFPGQAAQQPAMGLGLYDADPVFGAAVDRCLELFADHEPDLPRLWRAADETLLSDTRLAQPLLFTVEYALAQRWLAMGLVPDVVLGHSVGELVAATVAGVFDLEGAARAVAVRSRAMAATEPGGMLAVAADAEAVRDHVGDDVAIAVVNGPRQLVVAGPTEALARVADTLTRAGIATRRLAVSRAFHSPLMASAVSTFEQALGGLAGREPRMTMISATDGRLVTSAEAKDPAFWAAQLSGPVRFDRAVETLAGLVTSWEGGGGRVVLEVGPGQTLSALLRSVDPLRDADVSLVASLPRAAGDPDRDRRAIATAGARLWGQGALLDWSTTRPSPRRRVSAPGYPYQRTRYWPEPSAGPVAGESSAADAGSKGSPVAATDAPAVVTAAVDAAALPDEPGSPFGIPTWSERPRATGPGRPGIDVLVLLPGETSAPVTHAVLALRQAGHRIHPVRVGERYDDTDGSLSARADRPADLGSLLATLAGRGVHPRLFVHALGLVDWPAPTPRTVGRQFVDGVHGLVGLAREAVRHPVVDTLPEVLVLTSEAVDVTGAERLAPAKAAMTGIVRTLVDEAPELRPRLLDLSWPVSEDEFVEELRLGTDPVVALRGASRWLPGERVVDLPPRGPALRRGGTYLIAGGLGGLGRAVALALARSGRRPHLVLLGRTGLPPAGRADAGAVAADIADMTAAGAQVQVEACDIADPRAVRRLADGLRAAGKAVNGVLNLAGRAGDSMLLVRSATAVDEVLRPKVHGGLNLAETFGSEASLDFLVSFSSRAALSGLVGGGDYAAANAFVDAQMRSLAREGVPAQSIDWPAWNTVGMAAEPGEATAPAGALDWSVTVDPTREPILDEHRVAGVPVMPGTGHLDLVITGFRTMVADPGTRVRLDDIVFRGVLSTRSPRRLRCRFVPDGTSWRWEVSSRPEGARAPVVHVTGRIAVLGEQPPRREPLEALRARVTGPDFSPPPGARKLFHLGPRWDNLVVATSGETADGSRERLLELALPEPFADEATRHAMHPALLDSCTAAARDHSVAGVHVPFHYDDLVCFADLPARVISHVVRRPAPDGMLVADVTVYAEDGSLVATAQGFTMRRVEPEFFTASAERGAAPTGEVLPVPGGGDAAGGATPSSPEPVRGIDPEEGGRLLLRLLGHVRRPQVTVRPFVDGRPVPLATAEIATAPVPEASPSPVPRPTPGPVGGPTGGTGPGVARSEPPRSFQDQLAALWTQVLGISLIDPDDDFFELGGDSLMAVELIGKVRSDLGLATSIVAVFENPTLSGLATALREQVPG